MQTSTSELTIRKSELSELLAEAVVHHNHVEAARGAAENAQQLALFHAWQAGIRLNKIKTLVGHGNWQDWLEENFCQPRRITERTAQLYMKIDNDNPHLRNVKPNLKRVSDLRFDTVRKYMIGFVPEKAQPEHAGNKKFPRLASFLNIANEYSRLKQRHIDGLQSVDFQEAREETKELYQFLRWLHSDSTINPWANGRHPLGDNF
jgi:hypothetical protein